jgi:hypothetical protein
VSEKKEAKKEKTVKAAPPPKPVKKAKIDRMTKVKRGPDGKKVMKVARGTKRAARREGLKHGWRNVANAKQMAPSVEATASA